MRADPTKLMAQLQRLVSAFPPSNSFPADEVLRRYIEALDDIGLYDIETAVSQFVRGTVPGQNPRFAPTPPELATVCRRAAEGRNSHVFTRRAAVAQIEERDKDEDFAKLKTPEAIALVKDMVKGFVDSQDEKKKPKTTEEIAKGKEFLRLHDESFADQFIEANGIMVSHSLLRSLGRDVQ